MYNAEKFIIRCLESLVTQNIPKRDYEILVMDDGSTDNSNKIVADYIKEHSNIFLYSHDNVGAYSTRNKLLKLAKGTYIYNVDADDYIAHNTLNHLVKFAISNKLDLLGFGATVTNVHDQYETEAFATTPKPLIITGPTYLEQNKHLRIEIWWYLVRKEFLDTNEITFNNNEYNADVIFTIQSFLKAERVTYFPISIYRYYQSQNSIMRSTDIDHHRKRIEYSFSMILDFSNLINYIKKSSINNKDIIVDNLCFRRDVFLFFLIIRMIRNSFPSGIIQKKINALKKIAIYPIRTDIGKENNSLKYRLLNFIINTPVLLLSVNCINSYLKKLKLFFMKSNTT